MWRERCSMSLVVTSRPACKVARCCAGPDAQGLTLMYEQYYGFRMQPFELTSNPRFLLLTPTHREALSTLEYGISARKSITLLIGEAGTGKTTLLRTALAFRDGACGGADCVYLQDPRISVREFFERLALEFDLGGEAAASKTILMRRL